MNRAIRTAESVFSLALALGALAATKEPLVDFTGTWKLNMKKSRGAPDWRPDTVLVVLQSPNQIHFTYFLNQDARVPFENHDYVTNGKEEKLYASANEQTYYSVRWNSRNVLQVRVHHIVRSEIADTEWNETDIWTLSNDGKTLTNKLSDGKLIVYDRLDREKPLQY